MPRLRLLLPLAALALLPAWAAAADPFQALGVTRPERPEAAPGFTLPLTGGGEGGLEDYRGRVVLVNFWATWCVPCREEMPALEAIWLRHRDRGLVVLAVSEDRGRPRRVERFVSRLGLTFPVPLDPEGEVGRAYGAFGLPVTVIVARDGTVAGRVTGLRDWSGEAAERLLAHLLEDDDD